MSRAAPPKRKYDSSRRQAQARQTRRQIAEAARRLFYEYGDSGTTLQAIAQQAGVALQTVYAVFGSKNKILWHLMDISVGGDNQPIALLDRPGPQAVLRGTDQHRQITMFARGIAEILGRVAPLFEVLRAAAKTEEASRDLLRNLIRERMENMTVFVQHLAGNGSLRGGMGQGAAAEIVWTVTSPEVYLLLTRDRAYTQDRYAAWLEAVLERLLLP